MGKLRYLLMELRAPFFTGSIIPILLGSALAWRTEYAFSWLNFWLVLAGGVLLHAGANVANDYFDDKNEGDRLNKDFVSPFTGGSRLIQEGRLSPAEVTAEYITCYVLAFAALAYLSYSVTPIIFLLAIFGAFTGFYYSAPPFFFAGRGIGELLVGINFGPLLVLMSYAAQIGNVGLVPILVSLPIFMLITAVLYVNEFPDHKADKSVGKRNLVVRLGLERAVSLYIVLLAAAYLTIIMEVLLGFLPVYSLAALLTLPLAVKSSALLLKHYADPARLNEVCGLTILMHALIGLILVLSVYFAF